MTEPVVELDHGEELPDAELVIVAEESQRDLRRERGEKVGWYDAVQREMLSGDE